MHTTTSHKRINLHPYTLQIPAVPNQTKRPKHRHRKLIQPYIKGIDSLKLIDLLKGFLITKLIPQIPIRTNLNLSDTSLFCVELYLH